MPPPKLYHVDPDSILRKIDALIRAEIADRHEAIAVWRVERRRDMELSWREDWNSRRDQPIPAGHIEKSLADPPYPLNVEPSGWVYVTDVYDRDSITESQKQTWRKAIRDLRSSRLVETTGQNKMEICLTQQGKKRVAKLNSVGAKNG